MAHLLLFLLAALFLVDSSWLGVAAQTRRPRRVRNNNMMMRSGGNKKMMNNGRKMNGKNDDDDIWFDDDAVDGPLWDDDVGDDFNNCKFIPPLPLVYLWCSALTRLSTY
jgi:hypothetical protein